MKKKIFAAVLFVSSLLFASCTNTNSTVNNKVRVTGVRLDVNELYIICNDDDNTHQFTASVQPDDADNKNVTWSISNTNYGSITNNGLFTALAPGDTTVTVTTSDGGFTDTCLVHVQERIKTLDHIELSGTYKTTFWSTETFNHDGLVVTAYFNMGPSEEVTDFTVTEPDMSNYSQQTLTVSYFFDGVEKTATYNVTIQEDQISGLELSGNYRTEFDVGEEFSSEGLVVTLSYSSGYSRVLNSSEYTIDDVDMSSAGNKIVCIRYAENYNINNNYTITVNLVRQLVGISLSGTYQTEFTVGDTFSSEGLVVTADYVTETVMLTADQYSISTPDMNTAGENIAVTVSYTDDGITVSNSYTITINARQEITVSHTISQLILGYPFSSGTFTTKGIVTACFLDSNGTTYDIYIQEEGNDASAICLYRNSYAIDVGDYVLVSGNLTSVTKYVELVEVLCANSDVEISTIYPTSSNPYSVVTKETDTVFWNCARGETADSYVYTQQHGPFKTVLNNVRISNLQAKTVTLLFSDSTQVSVYFGGADSSVSTAVHDALETISNNGNSINVVGYPNCNVYNGNYTVQLLIRNANDIEENEPQVGELTIDVAAINDFHGAIEETNENLGLEKVASTLKYVGEQRNSLTISMGDDWQGSLYSNHNRGKLVNDAFAYAHLSARAVGNHDFDWGVDVLKSNTARAYQEYTTPVLAANIYDYDEANGQPGNIQQSDIGIPSVTYTLENGLKVGILGIIGKDQITSITSFTTRGLIFKDHVAAIKQEATNLRNDGCDIVIGSCHIYQDDMQGQGLESYVDLFLCGHEHVDKVTEVSGVKYAQFGSKGKAVGYITLNVDTDTKNVTSTSIDRINPSNFDSRFTQGVDQNVTNLVNSYVAACKREVDTDEVIASNVVGNFYTNNQAPNMMCKAIFDTAVTEGYSDIVFAYTNFSREALAYGQWTFADIYEAFPFDNVIYVQTVSGTDILNEAKYNYLYINPIYGESGEISIDRNASYRVAVIDYLLYHISVSNSYVKTYNYFKSFNGVAEARLTDTYRDILIKWLKANNYNNGNTLYASDFTKNSSGLYDGTRFISSSGY